MPIFISHTTKDDYLAQKVYRRLTNMHNIKCYIDDMDKELERLRGHSSLTPLLVERLRRCDTLLAVVTENTKDSWWVPFEIGTAREMPRAISCFTPLPDRKNTYNYMYNTKTTLPEYLLEWPRLRTDHDIDTFAMIYKRQASLLRGNMSMENYSYQEKNSRSFESIVMKSLGQRTF